MVSFLQKVVLAAVLLLTAIGISAQDLQVRRGNCLPDVETDGTAAARRQAARRLPAIINKWDSSRTYKQLVILISYADLDFTMENPREVYNDMFNTTGYNRRKGPGCVADYFKTQSNGMLNMEFDVFGPYKVSSKAQPFENPNADTRNYGRSAMREATDSMIAQNPTWDFSSYDWDGNGTVNQVIYISAGYTGNVDSPVCYGYIWPNTASFSTITAPGNKKISNYTVSCEHWPTPSKTLCGLGTVCHEFTHSLGLPDIYPTTSDAGFSVCDEWDLMDGGNFSNYGWCPPNFTPLEKMLLGWLTPVELSEPASIKKLRPAEEGGNVYLIRHSDSEYLLLENRQQKGWDAAAPGKGLVVYHVNYDKSVWGGNSVNNNKTKRRFELVHADNLDFDAWDKIIGGNNPYANSGYMNNRHLSTSPYPYATETGTNDSLTVNSVPAGQWYYPDIEGQTAFDKHITNITMDEDGTVSFDYMGGGTLLSVQGVTTTTAQQPAAIYDLNGRQQQSLQGRRGIYLLRQADGTVRKMFLK